MSDEQQIAALIERWLAATREGKVDEVLSLMAPDAIFLTAGQPPMEGHEAFAATLQAVLAGHQIESSSEIEEIVAVGDLAYCRTRLTVTIISNHGKLPLRRSGHTLSILRKGSDGKWQLTRDANMLA